MYDAKMSSLRVIVKSAYALQKLRIQTGLRLCANLRAKLKESTPPDEDMLDDEKEELSPKAKQLIKDLYTAYRRLTDGAAKRRSLPREEGFTGEGVISDFAELVIVHSYFELERQEREQFSLLGEVLETIPIYQQWLRDQIGIGPAMAGVLIAYFNINKATYPSQFWAFAGLDVGPPIDGFPLARCRRKEHLVEREYVDRHGETKTKMSTTFDPWVQSKLMGALSTSLIRQGSPYRRFYDNYRHRIETDPARTHGTLADKKKARKAGESGEHIWHPLRIHRASLRYMTKQFVADFWRRWREVEGLPTRPTYQEEKLGHKHHDEPPPRAPKQPPEEATI
jgi:hypothetical protein